MINRPGLTDHYEGTNHHGELVAPETTKVLAAGEMVDLTDSIQANDSYYR